MTAAPCAAGARGRDPGIDLTKALASQLIVLHHLAFYGPMADHAAVLWPPLFDALARHARIVVQVFLVLGGYLAARGLAPQGRLPAHARPLALLAGRYLRLVLPLAAVLVLAIVAAALAGRWMDHASVPAAPRLAQVLAHLLLLQDLLGIEALSAGVWYVAIDFQLYAMLLGVLLVARGIERRRPGHGAVAPWCVFGLVAASLLFVNREPAWDIGAPYFFGAYGLGVLAAWWTGAGGAARWRVALLALLVALALLLEYRSRIALAAAVAVALVGWTGRAQAGALPALPLVAWCGGISYALFLVHFPICLLVNAAFERFVPHTPWLQLAGVLTAWAASMAGAALFHRLVERPALQWVGRRQVLRAA